ncbi:hypothetical protein PQE71_gp044 [Bacillus phage Izhevsk]|uniref:Uncharacterized protein n=1 Tax=Bacillus phage Izhevsk TaxID=2724322 RepID=A0A6H0X609_9CAUD|nr:hypothetical protein PQE71_gp044 [Bacillus phage Izhevsk]QIW89726.1 hypothetical protein Izhevsk_44 [Bacillus phage Izhevsk]
MDLPTNEEYARAYEKWYCVTAKNPVSLSQYKSIMSRLPQDIKTINKWLDEGRKPV